MKPGRSNLSGDQSIEVVRQTVAVLRERLGDLVQSVTSPTPKPSRLVSKLGIDKTLASRLVKTVSSEGGLESLEHCPAPLGLRMFVRSVAAKGEAPPEQVAEAEEAIDAFEALNLEIAGGRAGLQTLLSDWVPAVRERTEREAKQAIFKATSHLMGYHAKAVLNTRILWPSVCGQCVDEFVLGWTSQLVRLHKKHRVLFFGTVGKSHNMQTIDQVPGGNDPYAYILEEYCSSEIPEFELVKLKDSFLFVLGPGQPSINQPMTIPFGFVSRHAMARYQVFGLTHVRLGVIARVPAELCVQDVFIHKDLYEGQAPEVGARRQGLPHGFQSPEETECDRVDIAIQTESFDGVLPPAALPTVRAHPDAVGAVFDRLALRLEDFHVYRIRVDYPPPFVMFCQWVRLPSVPEGLVIDCPE